MMLGKVPFAGSTVELTPLTPAGMAVGAQVAQPQPAAIVTARMGTEMPRSIDHTRAPVGRLYRIRLYRRRWRGSRGLFRTQGTRGLMPQARKGCGRLGAFALGRAGLRRS